MKEDCLAWICWIYWCYLFLPVAGSNGDGGSLIRTPQTQIVGLANKDAILRCDFTYPGGRPVAHIIEWSKRDLDVPIFILYQGYPPHVGSGYAARLALAPEGGEKASLLIRNVQREDEGWYECKVQLLNRPPETPKNGSWVYLVVHAPPQITNAPPAEIYVKQNDEVTFSCDASGTPKPKITWMKDGDTLGLSPKMRITETGLTLRSAGAGDVGTYECVAKNSEGRVSRQSKLIMASGAVILRPPENMTYLEGERANLHCKAEGKPNNLTFHWLFSDAPIEPSYYTELSSRVVVQTDGTLMINPTSKADTGKYTCRVTNGIEETPQASAWLSIEYPARITYNPTLQYLPLNLSGMIRCFVEANPPVQFVQWTKDNRVLDTKNLPAVTSMSNGSLLIEKVTMDHQGIYTCTPYNAHGTGGASIEMNVLVEEPPAFATIPKPFYQAEQKSSVTLLCAAHDHPGRPRPRQYWRRADALPLPADRTSTHLGALTIFNVKKSDHGTYQCIVENDVATLVASSELLIESTTPHAPTNITLDPGAFSVGIHWQPAYNGGYSQHYVVWYRPFGASSRQWRTLRVRPDDATRFTVYNLQPATVYEVQVLSRNQLGDGLFSEPVLVTTLDIDSYATAFPTDASGSTYVPSIVKPSGARPGSPVGVHIDADTSGRGVRVMWEPPVNSSVPVMYYMLEYRQAGEPWGRSSDPIAEGRTWYSARDVLPGTPYEFRVYAFTLTSFSEPSDIQRYTLTHEFGGNMSPTIAITAGIVGGVTFFVVSIVIVLCCIRCFKRKESKARYEANGTHRSNSPVPLKRGKRTQADRFQAWRILRRLKTTCHNFLLPRPTPSPWPLDDYGDIYATPDAVLPQRKPLHKARYSVQIQYTDPKPGSAMSGSSSECMIIRPCVRSLRPPPTLPEPMSIVFHPNPFENGSGRLLDLPGHFPSPREFRDDLRDTFEDPDHLRDPRQRLPVTNSHRLYLDYDRDQLSETIHRLRTSRSQEHLDHDVCADSGVAMTLTDQNHSDPSSGTASGFSSSEQVSPVGAPPKTTRSRSAHGAPPGVENRCRVLMEEFREYKRQQMVTAIARTKRKAGLGRAPLESEC